MADDDDIDVGDLCGDTEEEKRKRRQDRHRILERKRREKTQGLLAEIHQEIERHTGRRQPGVSSFTLNKSLNHVVNHVRRVLDADGGSEGGSPAAGGEAVMAALEVTSEQACGDGVGPAAQTSRKPADAEMKVIEAAIKACTTPVAFICMDGGIFDCNVAFYQMLGYNETELLGNTIYMHAIPTDIAPLMSAVCDLITDKSQRCRRALRLMHKNGHVVSCTFDMAGIRAGPEKVYIIVYVTEDNVDPSQQAHALHISLDNLSLNGVASAIVQPNFDTQVGTPALSTQGLPGGAVRQGGVVPSFGSHQSAMSVAQAAATYRPDPVDMSKNNMAHAPMLQGRPSLMPHQHSSQTLTNPMPVSSLNAMNPMMGQGRHHIGVGGMANQQQYQLQQQLPVQQQQLRQAPPLQQHNYHHQQDRGADFEGMMQQRQASSTHIMGGCALGMGAEGQGPGARPRMDMLNLPPSTQQQQQLQQQQLQQQQLQQQQLQQQQLQQQQLQLQLQLQQLQQPPLQQHAFAVGGGGVSGGNHVGVIGDVHTCGGTWGHADREVGGVDTSGLGDMQGERIGMIPLKVEFPVGPTTGLMSPGMLGGSNLNLGAEDSIPWFEVLPLAT